SCSSATGCGRAWPTSRSSSSASASRAARARSATSSASPTRITCASPAPTWPSPTCSRSLGCHERARELVARLDAQLAVARREVRLDGLDGQEERVGDLAVALAGRRELADLALARSQRLRFGLHAHTAGHELALGALGERLRPGPLGGDQRRAQLVA